MPKRPQCSSGLPHSRGSEFARAILVRACSAAVARLHSLGRRDSARRALRWRRSPARARRARRTIKAVGQAIAVRDVAVRAWLARRGQLERRADRAEAATSTRQAAGGASAVLVRSRPAELALGVARAKGKRAGTARHGSHAAGGASVARRAALAAARRLEVCLLRVRALFAGQRRRRAFGAVAAHFARDAARRSRLALIGPALATGALGEAARAGKITRRALGGRRGPAAARRAHRAIEALGVAVAVGQPGVCARHALRVQLPCRSREAELASSAADAVGAAARALVVALGAQVAAGVAEAGRVAAGQARRRGRAARGAGVALIAWRALRGDGEVCLVGVGTRVARQRRRRARLTIVARATVTAVCCARFALVGPARARRALGEAACDGESSLGARRLLRRAGGGVVARRSVGAFARSGEVRGVREGARLARQGRRSALGAEVARRAGAAARSARVVLEQSSGTFAAAQQV